MKIARYHYSSPTEYMDAVQNYKYKDESNKYQANHYEPSANRAVAAINAHNFEKESALIHGVVNELKTVDFSIAKWKFANRLKVGSRVDIGRYLEGRQDCWGGFRRQAKAKRTVRVYVQTGGNYNRSKKELAVSGAVAATITDILESVGVDVELWMCISSQKFILNAGAPIQKCISCVRLKSSNQFADLGMINYMAGAEEFFRGIGFKDIIMVADKENCMVSSNLGRHNPIDADTIGLDGYEKGRSIIIPAIYTIDMAKEYLTDLINNKLEKDIK